MGRRNTIISGFAYESAAIIEQLSTEGIIHPKAWFNAWEKKDAAFWKEASKYEYFSFKSDAWMKRYAERLRYYTEDIPFDRKAYDALAPDLLKLTFFFARSRAHSTYSRTYSAYTRLSDYRHSIHAIFRLVYGIFIKEEIELVLLSNIPHEGVDHIIYTIAKHLGIRVIILTQSLVSPQIFFLDDVRDYGTFSYMRSRPKQEPTPFKLQPPAKGELWYMRRIKYADWGLRDELNFRLKRILYALAPESKLKLEQTLFRRADKRCFVTTLKRLERSAPDFSVPFVYFPLHLQPELSTSAIGDIYDDQLLALDILSQLIPDHWKIYVKENPKQTANQRGQFFFTRLATIKKAELISRREDSHMLIEKSQFVATITGTAAWESIRMGKPALCFGNPWFKGMPGIFHYDEQFKLSDLLSASVDLTQLEAEVKELLSHAWPGLIDLGYSHAFEKDGFAYSEPSNRVSVTTLIKSLLSE